MTLGPECWNQFECCSARHRCAQNGHAWHVHALDMDVHELSRCSVSMFSVVVCSRSMSCVVVCSRSMSCVVVCSRSMSCVGIHSMNLPGMHLNKMLLLYSSKNINASYPFKIKPPTFSYYMVLNHFMHLIDKSNFANTSLKENLLIYDTKYSCSFSRYTPVEPLRRL
jgi:hypothetical protein